MAGFVELFAPGFAVAGGQLDFEVFADVDGAQALVAHLFEGAGDGFALRVEHGLFGSDDNFCFHGKRTEGCWVKRAGCASFFCRRKTDQVRRLDLYLVRKAVSQLAFALNGRYGFGMSTVVEISAAIEKLDVKEQVELLGVLPKHLKISLDDLAWSRLAEPAFEFWNNPEDAIYDQF
jgi:hypothetical protein